MIYNKLYSDSLMFLFLGSQAQPPKYLSIEGHKDCLGMNKKPNQLFPSVCLHQNQPKKCKNSTWKQLYELIGNDGFEPCVLKGIWHMPKIAVFSVYLYIHC